MTTNDAARELAAVLKAEASKSGCFGDYDEGCCATEAPDKFTVWCIYCLAGNAADAIERLSASGAGQEEREPYPHHHVTPDPKDPNCCLLCPPGYDGPWGIHRFQPPPEECAICKAADPKPEASAPMPQPARPDARIEEPDGLTTLSRGHSYKALWSAKVAPAKSPELIMQDARIEAIVQRHAPMIADAIRLIRDCYVDVDWLAMYIRNALRAYALREYTEALKGEQAPAASPPRTESGDPESS